VAKRAKARAPAEVGATIRAPKSGKRRSGASRAAKVWSETVPVNAPQLPPPIVLLGAVRI
jgi:hypothetical protein